MHFQVIVAFLMEKPLHVDDVTTDAYLVTFGVNASVFAESVAFAEEAIAQSDSHDGLCIKIESEVVSPQAWPEEVRKLFIGDPNKAGVFFESGRVYYSSAEDEDQETD